MVTGAAGFIGSHFVDHVLENHPEDQVIGFDCLTYAGNMKNLELAMPNKRFEFVKGDIRNPDEVESVMARVDAIINFAAETHVDRSIASSNEFISSNVLGVNVLLESALKYRTSIFLQISTDEVYGSVQYGTSLETDRLNPSSAYSASKAAADLLVGSFHTTHRLNTRITRASNNYGLRQYPEKLIPLSIERLIKNEKIPVYGNGQNIRDWQNVHDHVKGIYMVLEHGKPGEIYNLGGNNLKTNLEIITLLLEASNKDSSSLEYVADRKGHDFRYAMDCSKANKHLGYKPERNFELEIKRLFELSKNIENSI